MSTRSGSGRKIEVSLQTGGRTHTDSLKVDGTIDMEAADIKAMLAVLPTRQDLAALPTRLDIETLIFRGGRGTPPGFSVRSDASALTERVTVGEGSIASLEQHVGALEKNAD